MKPIFILVSIFSIGLISGFSQKYTTTPNSVYTNFISDSSDHIGHAILRNHTKEKLSLNWIREIVEMTPGWTLQICDCNYCYQDNFYSSPNVNYLKPYDSCSLEVHVNDHWYTGQAHIILWLFENQDTTNKYRTDYYFNKIVSNKEVSLINIKLFPNPVNDHFTVDFNQGLKMMELYSSLGIHIQSYEAIQNKKYDISGLNSGMYFLKLIDEQNQLVRTIRIMKVTE
jgi:hypothetical protein